MAQYYALLARAVGALERNDESTRREIYVKARSALIRQLKAITPPLPPAEISKQRLSLEEAIRRIEKEAAEAAAATRLSEEEISRRAEQALERALAPGGDDDPDRPSEFGGDALRAPPPPRQAPPTFEPQPEIAEPTTPPPQQPRQPTFEPQPDIAEPVTPPPPQQPRQPTFEPQPDIAEPVTPPPPQSRHPTFEPQPEIAEPIGTQPPRMPEPPPPRRMPEPPPRRGQEPPRRMPEPPQREARDAPPPPPPEQPQSPPDEGYAEVVRPRPAERTSPRAPGWERAATVTDVEEAPRARPGPPPLPAGRESRQERKERKAAAKRGGRGWERTGKRHGRRSVVGMLGGLGLTLIVLGAAGFFLWDFYGDDITVFFGGEVAQEETAAQVAEGAEEGEGAPIEEPPPFVETIAYLYSEPTTESPISDRFEASIEWALVTDEEGASAVTAAIEVPDQGLTISLRFEESADPDFSHQVSTLVTQSGRFDDDPIQVVDNLAIKTSEEGIGAALEGDEVAEPDFYLLALPENNRILNTNRLLQSPWFDLSIVYESGRRAIVAFNKGTVGDEIFVQVGEAWAAN